MFARSRQKTPTWPRPITFAIARVYAQSNSMLVLSFAWWPKLVLFLGRYCSSVQFISCHRGVFAASSGETDSAGAAPRSGSGRRHVVVGGRRVKTIDVHAH